jgi:putative transposase
MITLARFFHWREALAVVEPDTFIKRHRAGFKMFWLWKSCPSSRPSLPKNLHALIWEMAGANQTWGEE